MGPGCLPSTVEEVAMKFETLAYLRSLSKVSGPAHHLLLMLALYAEKDTDISRPSEARLALALHVTPRHIRRLLRELEAVGAIAVEPGGGRHTNRYFVVTPDEDELSTPRTPMSSVTGHPGPGCEDTHVPRNKVVKEVHEIEKRPKTFAHEEGSQT